ncbi:MAG: HAD family hydrolase [Chloroflexi bacterium]|nr:HAD family hydrolase [Chloroflexota bacterium]
MTENHRIPDGIKAVIFDLDGTLRQSRPDGHELFWDYAAKLGAPDGPDRRRKALQWSHEYWADSEDLLIDLKTYGMENGEFWLNYAKRHLLALGARRAQALDWAAQMHQFMSENYDPEDIIPDDVIPTLAALRQRGYTVGLVTNRSRPVPEYLEEKGLLPHLDFQFAAGEIGMWKPKPEIFYYALGLANARPHEALYVGDNYFADVVGARGANILPVLIDPQGLWEGVADCATIRAIGELAAFLPEREQ